MGRPYDFMEALAVVETVFEEYAKDHPAWMKRLDGTPIVNDLAVRLAETFTYLTREHHD